MVAIVRDLNHHNLVAGSNSSDSPTVLGCPMPAPVFGSEAEAIVNLEELQVSDTTVAGLLDYIGLDLVHIDEPGGSTTQILAKGREGQPWIYFYAGPAKYSVAIGGQSEADVVAVMCDRKPGWKKYYPVTAPEWMMQQRGYLVFLLWEVVREYRAGEALGNFLVHHGQDHALKFVEAWEEWKN